ncbi:MAG: HAD-IA family hydrolase [Calditrichia bacterium]
MIKYIIFDLGNVLVEIHPQRTMEAFARRCNWSRDIVSSFYLSDLHLGFMDGKFPPGEFYRIMMERHPCNIDPAEFKSLWNQVIGEPKDGIEDLLSQLEKKFILAVCSNTDPWHWQKVVNKFSFIKKFKHNFLSFEMGVNKPDSRIFEMILKDLNIMGNSCIFIDDLKENIDAALKTGITGICSSDPAEIKGELQSMKII